MADSPAPDNRPLPTRIWSVEDYYRVKEFYDARGLVFNPALQQGSPAAYHVAVQAQLREKYKASAAVERAGEGAAPRSGGTDSEAKGKRSTEQGEARAKLIAALTKHHQYYNGSCGNLAPIGNNDLARKAEVSPSTASEFFRAEFGGYGSYKRACADPPTLVAALKLLNQEFSPHHLFGNAPPNEDGRSGGE